MEPEVRKVLKRHRCSSETADQLETKMADLDLSCQNDSCQNFGGKVDRCQSECRNGNGYEEEDYSSDQMEEIGRTRLEVNDVCYINGEFLLLVPTYSSSF